MIKDHRPVKVMFGTMEGELRRGRLCKEWLDDIKERGNSHIQQKGAGSRHMENGVVDGRVDMI